MITILGATGKVGGKIADILAKKGEKVRLVARSGDRLRALVGRNVEAFSGDVLNTEFLSKALEGSDAVFALVPPNLGTPDFLEYAGKVIDSISRAVETAKVWHVVNLSSVGAELEGGTGPITGLHRMEERLNRIKGLNVVHLRAAYFMENLLWQVEPIRSRGIVSELVRGDIKRPMIATRDIATFAAERLAKRDFTGSSVRYLLGQRDLSMNEAIAIIGRKVGIPALRFVKASPDEAEKGYKMAGLSADMTRNFIEMGTAFNDGRITWEDRRPENTTSTPFEQFCDEVFVPIYSQKKAA